MMKGQHKSGHVGVNSQERTGHGCPNIIEEFTTASQEMKKNETGKGQKRSERSFRNWTVKDLGILQ
jgi:hypothetical protein